MGWGRLECVAGRAHGVIIMVVELKATLSVHWPKVRCALHSDGHAGASLYPKVGVLRGQLERKRPPGGSRGRALLRGLKF